MELRPYQRTCINAVNQYLRNSTGHPVVSIPTAGGKTIIFGTMIREWLEAWPGSRVCILAHRQELLTQAEEKIKAIWPEAPISVYSAGLKRRELTEDILIAGIQSIYKRADEVRPFDIAIVDECFTGDTKISTPAGKKRLDQMRCGDTILIATGVGEIEAISARQVSHLLCLEFSDGTKIKCTENHPVFTERGWVKAGALELGQILFSERGLRLLWQGVLSLEKRRSRNKGVPVETAEVLLDLLCQEIREPHEQPAVKIKNEGHLKKDSTQAYSTRRERVLATFASTCPAPRSRGGMERRGSGSDEKEAQRWLCLLLQNRHSKQGKDDRNRSGRRQPLDNRKTGKRREESPSAYFPRLVNISRLEQKSPRTVFNLRVGGHPSYFANGKLVHNCHLIPNSSETMYRAFIDDLLDLNPALRVIGWTATPYRLDGGELAGPEEEKLFDHVCYEADINELIRDGYLCELKTKATDVRLDATGIHTRQGDFVQGEMDRRFSNRGIVEKAVEEIVQKADSRKSWLVFCCGVDHARAVLHEIRSYGVDAELVIGKTDKEDRREILQRFDSGDLRCIVNVNCLTTGLDITRIDMIAMLRPTQSTSLWVQAVGRGFRLHPEKSQGCLILDFGENCLRHGPINNIKIQKKGAGGGDGSAPVKTCPECKEYVMAGVKECPECGHQFPEREVSHLSKASEAQILANAMDAPATIDVDYVSVRRHTKASKPDSIRVSYHCGLNVYSEWICFDHGGYAAEKARYWWMRRFSSEDRPPVPEVTEEALYALLRMNNGVSPINSHGSPNYHHDLSSMTRSVRIQRQGKYMQVLQVHLDNEKRTVRNV